MQFGSFNLIMSLLRITVTLKLISTPQQPEDSTCKEKENGIVIRNCPLFVIKQSR